MLINYLYKYVDQYFKSWCQAMVCDLHVKQHTIKLRYSALAFNKILPIKHINFGF